jgi:hypothetical protein
MTNPNNPGQNQSQSSDKNKDTAGKDLNRDKELNKDKNNQGRQDQQQR